MRIGYVVPRFFPLTGGVETHVERIASHAASLGHQVEVITQRGVAEHPSREEHNGVTIRRFDMAVNSVHYAASPELWRYVRAGRCDFDVLHGHNYHALPALAGGLWGSRPFVMTPHYHGTSASRFRRSLHRLYRVPGRVMLERSAAMICVSDREARLLADDFPSIAGRIDVIHNGVDVEEIQSALPWPHHGKVILSAGRLEEYKQVDRVLRAMQRLDHEYSLVIVGAGPAKSDLVRGVADLGLADRVAVLGRVSDEELRRWFRTASVYVTMSLIEAMPITPLETLCAGAKVVASDIDAHREIVDVAGGAVSLVPVDAGETALAAAIDAAAEAEPREATVASWEEVADATIEIYERVTVDAGSSGVGSSRVASRWANRRKWRGST